MPLADRSGKNGYSTYTPAQPHPRLRPVWGRPGGHGLVGRPAWRPLARGRAYQTASYTPTQLPPSDMDGADRGPMVYPPPLFKNRRPPEAGPHSRRRYDSCFLLIFLIVFGLLICRRAHRGGRGHDGRACTPRAKGNRAGTEHMQAEQKKWVSQRSAQAHTPSNPLAGTLSPAPPAAPLSQQQCSKGRAALISPDQLLPQH